MTNAEKYLKEGVNLDEVERAFEEFCIAFNNCDTHTYRTEMREFLWADCKPTLTEDERVILRNIEFKDYNIIGRKETGDLYVNYQENDSFNGTWFIMFKKHLFQFIKERRRI